MTCSVTVKTIYNCSLERAFKTPILCDVTKVHTGFGLMPRVTDTSLCLNWGQPGSTKKIFTAKTFMQNGGEQSEDKVLERVENVYWKIEVGEFKTWLLGFTKFAGEWRTTEVTTGKVLVEYTYTLHSNSVLLYPLNWLFAKTFWRIYMKRVIENIRVMAYDEEPYLYA
jgi:hypothetical protein